MTQPKVLIVGAGGVGIIAAVAFKTTGKCEVSLLVRDKTVTSYDINSCDYGKIANWAPHHIVNGPNETEYDFVCVTTKNIPDSDNSVADIIEPYIKPKTTIVLIQNGIDIELPIYERYPHHNVISGVSYVASTKHGREVIQKHVDKLFFGAFSKDNSDEIAKAKQLVELYQNEHNQCHYDPDIRDCRWGKLIYNASMNTTTALVHRSTMQCLTIDTTENLLFRPAMDEIIKIAAADGYTLDEERVEYFINVSKTVDYKPSMCVDSENGRMMELEVILGNPIRTADRLGVDVPVLKTLYGLLRIQQAKLANKL